MVNNFYTIRRLSYSHILELVDMLNNELTEQDKKYFNPFDFTVENFFPLVKSTKDYYYVLMNENGKIVGYGHMRTFDGKYEIPALGIAISIHFRGLGLSKFLCNYMIDDIKKLGYKSTMLKVHATNLKAISLYTNLGFQTVTMDEQLDQYYMIRAI